MKIYQIHEYYGDWEDFRDYIRSSYLSKEKAIADKKQREEKEKQLTRCNRCPLYDYDLEESLQIIKAKEYCEDYELFDKNQHNPELYEEGDCVNWNPKYDESTFEIKEVEVIE